MKKNIIIVIPTLRMGGAEKSLVSLLKALEPNRFNVDLFLFEAGGILQSEIPDWINIIEADLLTRGMTLEMRNYLGKVIYTRHFRAASARVLATLNAKFGRKNRFNWKILEKYIPQIKRKYDVAVGYLEGFADFFVLDKIEADKKIGWIHIDFSGRNVSSEEIKYYNRFDELVTISDVCRDAFIRAIPQVEFKIHILENIVLAREVREKAAVKISDKWIYSDIPQLVSVGRLDYQKGIDIAARAAKILSNHNIPFCWHIYGKGIMQDEIERYIKEQQIEDVFILEGLRENPYPYMKRADIIVQPSRWEGKSIVLDEAKILGKAIVVTAYPSVTDQIIDRVTGLITRMEPEAIAEGIELLIRDRLLKKRLEENAANEPNHSCKTLDMFYKLIEE